MSKNPGGPGSQGKRIDGLAAAAELLSGLSPEDRKRILGQLTAIDPALTRKLEGRMRVFEDLLELSDADLRLVLAEVPHTKLVLALRRAPDALHEAIYRGMTARAGEMLREEVAGQGPKRVSDIQSAQADILRIAARLAEEGRISFKR